MHGGLKIVAKYVLDKNDEKEMNWNYGAGDRTIVFDRPNAPINIKIVDTPRADKIREKKHYKPHLKMRKGDFK